MKPDIINKKLGRIAYLCAKINTEAKDAAFFNYFGHVNSIEVKIYRGGWDPARNPDINMEISLNYYDPSNAVKECILMLEKHLHDYHSV